MESESAPVRASQIAAVPTGRRRPIFGALGINLAFLVVAFVLSIAAGPVLIPPGSVVRILIDGLPGVSLPADWPETFAAILFKVRLPHAVLVAITGAALGGSGAAYQGLFRNPLADPYLIGVASGAGLGAIAAMSLEWPRQMLGLYAIPAAAFIGAALTLALVYSLARTAGTLPTTTLILAGVAVSSFATSLTSLLMLRGDDEIRRALGWLLGGSILNGWEPVAAVLPYVAVGLLILSASGHALNVLQFGEDQAEQLGLPAERVKTILLLAASLTTAAAVAFSGIIGFVGLVVPHVMRLVWGPDYRRLVPLSIVGGCSMLLLADLLARLALAPQVLPVGIVTALAGAPFFLWILRRSKSQAQW